MSRPLQILKLRTNGKVEINTGIEIGKVEISNDSCKKNGRMKFNNFHLIKYNGAKI